MTIPSDAVGGEADVGDVDPRLCGGDGFFPVRGEAAASSEPCEGSFHDPSARQDLLALCGVGPLDDFDGPLADPVERAAQLGARVPAVGEDVAQATFVMDRGVDSKKVQSFQLDVRSVPAPIPVPAALRCRGWRLALPRSVLQRVAASRRPERVAMRVAPCAPRRSVSNNRKGAPTGAFSS